MKKVYNLGARLETHDPIPNLYKSDWLLISSKAIVLYNKCRSILSPGYSSITRPKLPDNCQQNQIELNYYDNCIIPLGLLLIQPIITQTANPLCAG